MAEENVKPQKAKKLKYRDKLIGYLNEYKNILLVKIDNVGSRQLQLVRLDLRGEAVVLMGKNTVMRKIIRDHLETNPALEPLVPHLVGNIGFIFTNGDLADLRKRVEANKVPAPARSGMIAPTDVFIPPGPTGLDPGQTSFFQALNIATKIAKGSIEIINTVHLIRKNERVTSSAVSLLVKLGIKPFFFGITALQVYEDGSVYAAEILDLSANDLAKKFANAASMLAALSLEIGYPNAATLPHQFGGALKKMIAISLVTDYTFDESAVFKDPEALAAMKAAAGSGGGGGGGGGGAAGGAAPAAAAAAAAAAEPEEEEETAGVDLFGGGGDY